MPPILSESQPLRFCTLAALYYAQGLPVGLFALGLKPFLLQEGTTQEELGALMAVVFLPWSLKMAVAPVMDAFPCRRFGYRRPFIILGQFGLVAMLYTLAVLTWNISSYIRVLHSIAMMGFLVFLFAVTQDVAVDGMAIDILPQGEQGRANSFMAAAQTLGSATMGALSGQLLPTIGLSGAAMLCALLVTPVLVLVVCVLERPGERRVPDSQCTEHCTVRPEATGPTGGDAVDRSAHAKEAPLLDKAVSFARGLLLSRASLLIMLQAVATGIGGGIQGIVTPKLALEKGLSAKEFSLFISMLRSATSSCST